MVHKTYKILGMVRENNRLVSYLLGYTSGKKSALKVYKESGWSSRPSKNKPYIKFEEVKK